MNNKKEQPFQISKKGMAAAAACCFVAVVTLVGAYTFSHYKSEMKSELAKAEKETELLEEKSEMTNTADIVLPEADGTEGLLAEGGTMTEQAEAAEPAAEAAPEVSETAGAGSAVAFQEEDTLLWPLDGNVLMNYSMDKSIYFATLDQYKYNPAVIISGEVGAEVKAAAAGTVSSVETFAQTGTTVSIDMGNGYAAIYGQLKEIPVEVGEFVEADSVIGYVSEPSKYYSVEGANLYFQLLKDGQPVNPMDYIAYE